MTRPQGKEAGMSARDVKRVPSTVVVGPHGQLVVMRGYTEIAGVRLYEDRLIVGKYGEPIHDPGYAALHAMQEKEK